MTAITRQPDDVKLSIATWEVPGDAMLVILRAALELRDFYDPDLSSDVMCIIQQQLDDVTFPRSTFAISPWL